MAGDKKHKDQGAKPKVAGPKGKGSNKKTSKKQSTSAGTLKAEVKRTEKQIKSIKKELKNEGPKPDNTFAADIWMGDIDGSQDPICKVMTINPHPLLCKSNTAGAKPTPLSVKASQYNQWRLKKFIIQAQPLCSSAVSGTTILMSWASNPGGNQEIKTFDTLLCTPHKQAPTGRSCNFTITQRQCNNNSQPEGWFLTDTNAGPNRSQGWDVSIYTVGAAENMYTNTPWSKPLWRITVRAVYQFANYSPEAKQIQLHNEMVDEEVTIGTDPEGDMVMQTNSPTLRYIFREDDIRRAMSNGGENIGETIVQVGDTVVDTVATVTGPWGWLIKGGWWCIKKIFGYAAANDGDSYKIYPSWEAAAGNSPCHGGPTNPVKRKSRYNFQQLNNPNLGPDGTGSGLNTIFETQIPTPYPIWPATGAYSVGYPDENTQMLHSWWKPLDLVQSAETQYMNTILTREWVEETKMHSVVWAPQVPGWNGQGSEKNLGLRQPRMFHEITTEKYVPGAPSFADATIPLQQLLYDVRGKKFTDVIRDADPRWHIFDAQGWNMNTSFKFKFKGVCMPITAFTALSQATVTQEWFWADLEGANKWFAILFAYHVNDSKILGALPIVAIESGPLSTSTPAVQAVRIPFRPKAEDALPTTLEQWKVFFQGLRDPLYDIPEESGEESEDSDSIVPANSPTGSFTPIHYDEVDELRRKLEALELSKTAKR